MWFLKVAFWVAFLVLTWRHVLIVKPTSPPSKSLPLLNKLL